MEDKLLLMKEKIKLLNEANKAYYQEDREIMSNYEYDKLYDELKKMEEETGVVLSNSPTLKVGYELLSNLPKERHEKAMLSLDKTKEVSALKDWLGEKTGVLSWKLDGLTIVMTYEGGRLTKAVTRGNGEVGEVVTNNAKVFTNIPLTIAYKGSLVLRGEAVISYSDFNKLNQLLPETEGKYKNPRNLCSGSVRQLNNKITAERNVGFYAFSVVKADVDFNNSRISQLNWLKNQGFSIVEFKRVTQENIEDTVRWFEDRIKDNDLPSDGLVLTYDDIKYGESLGTTAKFPRDSIAFKWRDIYILRSFYNYCCKKDICSKNLPSRIEPVKVKEKERDFITEEEFEELVNAIRKPVLQAAAQTMFYTGGRISEILNLKLEDVDLENRVIHIIAGKGNKDRDIPINDKLYKILKNYLENIRYTEVESDRFFATEKTHRNTGGPA